MNLLLNVENLKTYFKLDDGLLKAVDDVSITMDKGQTLGLVGESGCGKSVTAQSIMRIVPPPGTTEGKIHFSRSGNGRPGGRVDLAELEPSGKAIRDIRGKDITMIFQEPMTSFSPLHTIGNQICEAIRLHTIDDKIEAREIAKDMLGKVGIPNPSQRIDEYPHQLSGGMRQRAMIAMALSCNPLLLIADEPTTALDVTVQAQVLKLMADLKDEYGMAMLYITHDLGVIAEIADEVAVMYLGRIVEHTNVEDIFYHPLHPYTKALLGSIPKLGETSGKRLASIEGTVPIPINVPPGCTFRARCPVAIQGKCEIEDPPLYQVDSGHLVRCYHYTDRHKENA
jgi:peptide/nickel transport system ATP-binding protein